MVSTNQNLKPINTEQLKRIKSVDTRVIVLFTHMMYVPTIMRDAFDVGLLEAGYAWLIVDIHEQFVSLQFNVMAGQFSSANNKLY